MSDNKSCKKGYRYHRISIKGRLIDEHRLVMEKYLGRRLSSDEVVHHIDGDIDNNDIYNLYEDNDNLTDKFKYNGVLNIDKLLLYVKENYKGILYKINDYNVINLFTDIIPDNVVKL